MTFIKDVRTPFGPSGEDVYNRTYSRIKDDGQRESWPETVRRVVDGNLGLVDEKYHFDGERDELVKLMEQFAIIPAGRHLWLSGVEGKQFINNCWVAGWDDDPDSHFLFTFDQLMQGGGVGSNYSNVSYRLNSPVELHLVIDESHPDDESLQSYVSGDYCSDSKYARAVEDSREGWVNALALLFRAWRTGSKDLVLDLSRIRASGTKIKTFGGTSAGPLPLAKLLTNVNTVLWDCAGVIGPIEAMRIDHAIAECVVSGNVRRSARMSILHWESPQIFEFIALKQNVLEHWSTNISVEIDVKFFEALSGWGHPDQVDLAADVYDAVCRGMLENGEPGFWNSSLSNVDEPNEVTATNPCGEIVLPEWGVCNLGHINMDYFWNSTFSMHRAAGLMARFLVRATFADIPNPEARAVQDRDRRIGVGVFGYHGFVAKNGIRYSKSHRNYWVRGELDLLRETIQEEARQYAKQLRIPEPVKCTTVAPTGTIAKMPGRTEGIHPLFSPYFLRRIRFSTVDPDQRARLEEYRRQGFLVEDDLYSANTAVVTIPSKEPLVEELELQGVVDPRIVLEGAHEISLEDQLGVQQMFQECYADNAVSFTVNIPEGMELEKLKSGLLPALAFLKGTTVFPAKSRPQSPYEAISPGEYQFYTIDTGLDEECASGACPVK